MLHLTRFNLFVAVDPRLYSVLAIKELPWQHPRLFLLYVSADGCPMTHIKWRQNGPVYWFSLPTCIFLMSASICYDGLIMMQRLASCGTIGIVSYIMFQTCVFLFSSEAWSGIMVDYTYHTELLIEIGSSLLPVIKGISTIYYSVTMLNYQVKNWIYPNLTV